MPNNLWAFMGKLSHLFFVDFNGHNFEIFRRILLVNLSRVDFCNSDICAQFHSCTFRIVTCIHKKAHKKYNCDENSKKGISTLSSISSKST